jgi:hypothetical protein
MIEKNVVSVEDGLAFATNQNNLLLSLKGLTSSDDFIRSHTEGGYHRSDFRSLVYSLTD